MLICKIWKIQPGEVDSEPLQSSVQYECPEQQKNADEKQRATLWYSAAQNNPQNETWKDELKETPWNEKLYMFYILSILWLFDIYIGGIYSMS